MMNWKACRRKLAYLALRCCPGIYPGGLRITTKISVRIDLQAEI
jgi:hypothetical protein